MSDYLSTGGVRAPEILVDTPRRASSTPVPKDELFLEGYGRQFGETPCQKTWTLNTQKTSCKKHTYIYIHIYIYIIQYIYIWKFKYMTPNIGPELILVQHVQCSFLLIPCVSFVLNDCSNHSVELFDL